MTDTYTFTKLEISPASFDEIADKLCAAGYARHCGAGVIDMRGIALVRRDDRRSLFCIACGKTFKTSAYQARYCSPKCRNRVQKRRHRARRAELAELARLVVLEAG